MTTNICPKYQLAAAVFNQFDQPAQRETENKAQVVAGHRNPLRLEAAKNKFLGLPNLVTVKILNRQIANTNDWLYATGQLGTTKNRLSASVTKATATPLLNRLGIEKKPNVAKTEQIWTRAFESVYANADEATKLRIIGLATKVDPTSMRVTSFQVTCYRANKLAAAFFGSWPVKLGVALVIGYSALILTGRLQNKFNINVVKVPGFQKNKGLNY